ncbi:MAG: hypothetical protein M5U09_19215 [Gammaproteobacteria bacterium]|nr:hypothetical protein [Gammaproteobacteria bacterium]
MPRRSGWWPAGTTDHPVQCAEALRAACERAGIPCDLRVENGGHWLDGKVWATMASAFPADLLRALCADFVGRFEGG